MFRRIIIWLIFLAAGFGLKCLFAKLFQYNPKKTKYGLVRRGTGVLVMGVLGVLFGGGVIYAMLTYSKSRVNLCLVPFFGTFFLTGVWWIVSWFCYKIWYDEKAFTVRKLLTSRKYSYTDITGIREEENVYLFMKKGGVCIDSISEGGKWFVHTAKEKYAEMNNGREIPSVFRRSGNLFKRHIGQLEEFIVFAALLSSFLGGILVYIIFFG